MDDKKIKDDLDAERRRVNEWLVEKRHLAFGALGNAQFQAKSGVGRGQCPGVVAGTASPSLDTMYLWARACGRSLQELFHGHPDFIDEKNLRTHELLESMIRDQKALYLIEVIEDAYAKHGPKIHGATGKKRRPRPAVIAKKKSQPA